MLDLVFENLDGAVRYERYVVSRCPFHSDHKPSFFVYPDAYYCASCKAHGKTKDLLRKLTSLPERVILNEKRYSDNPFSKWINEWGLSQTVRLAQRNTPSNYLDRRGIPSQEQRNLHLGILEGFITFPIYNHWKELVGAVARVGENNVTSSKYYIPKGQNPDLLYVPSWDMIKEQDTLYVTFGIIDAITLYLIGKASASTTTGQRINPSSFNSIRKRIIFVPDQGEESSASKLTTHLDWRGSVKLLDYPPGTKDISDFYNFDREGLLSAI